MTKIKAKKKKQQLLTAIKQHWKTVSACVLTFPFIIYASIELYFRIIGELAGTFTWDALLYFTVGKGILNGVVPWSGLFENKPPGIFLLSALSFKFFDSHIFTNYFQAFVLLLTAAVPAAAFFLLSNYRSVLKLGFAMLAGLMLSLYSSSRSGGIQVESFGAAFACIAVFAMAMPAQDFEKRKILWTSLSVIGILGACGFKEPFLFPIFGASLILCANAKAWAFRFALPLAIAVLLGIVFLLACGWMEAYLHYLSYMSFSHISGHGSSPLGRALRMDKLFSDLNALYWGLAIAFFALMFLPLALFFANARRNKNALLLKIALFGAALFLASFAVGVGGYYFPHHYVFALPFYMALVLLLLKNWEGENSAASKLGLASFVFLAVAVFNLQNITSEQLKKRIYWDIKANTRYERIVENQSRMEAIYRFKELFDARTQEARQAAAYLDSKMDELGIDRYAYVGGGGPALITGWTKHSPEGQFFFVDDYFFQRVPGYADSLISTLKKADIVVSHKVQFIQAKETYLTIVPWLRQNINTRYFEMQVIGDYQIYIRKNRMPKRVM